MKLTMLSIPRDAQITPPKKKVLTDFERKRAACQTYNELVELGYAEKMDFPERWAEHVMLQRIGKRYLLIDGQGNKLGGR